MADPRTLAALGGGGFSMEPENLALDRWLLSLTGKKHPQVLFLPTASGDSDNYVQRFFTVYTTLECRPAWLPLFRRTGDDVRATIADADLVFVGGGNTANMLAIWRTHGVDLALREAWENGTVMAGLSAGAICWFEQGSTDSFGPGLAPMDCLGWLPGSFCPHYDGEAARRPRFHGMVAGGVLAPGIAADDGCAVLYRGTQRVEVVTSRKDAAAYEVTLLGGDATERRLEARQLP
ncbi:MAG: peptidase E [Myxococcota bacterium]|nr:peptidase E [Myxococcota bacterium]